MITNPPINPPTIPPIAPPDRPPELLDPGTTVVEGRVINVGVSMAVVDVSELLVELDV
jgi:hypothetical protein